MYSGVHGVYMLPHRLYIDYIVYVWVNVLPSYINCSSAKIPIYLAAFSLQELIYVHVYINICIIITFCCCCIIVLYYYIIVLFISIFLYRDKLKIVCERCYHKHVNTLYAHRCVTDYHQHAHSIQYLYIGSLSWQAFLWGGGQHTMS